VTYKIAKVTPAKYKKYFKMNKKTGNVTVKKGLKKGTYRIKAAVTAAGNRKYKKKTKKATFKVIVKPAEEKNPSDLRGLIDIYCAQTARDAYTDEDLELFIDLILNKLEPQAVEMLLDRFPCLRAAADQLFPGLEKVAFEEHLKSFYHYVLMQDEEQRRQSVLLLDGWSEEELVLYSLSYNKKTRPIVCFPEELRLKIPAEADAAQKDQILCSAVRGLMQEKEYSAAYLTGEALGGGWMKESLNLICRGRRAFQGDTLYSKGAADSTMAACGLSSKADKYFYLSKDALRCNIGMDCLKKGRTVYQPLLDAGAEWYDAAAQIDILLEDGDEIVLRETSVDRGNEREIAVKLENMPKRPRATTRLRIRLHMTSADRMQLTAEDLGFGEIFPSTGMKWEQEIVING
jgi:hypothetical protein